MNITKGRGNLNNVIMLSMQDIIKNRNNKYVIADETSADFWGFSPFINKEITFIVPKGYNPNVKNKNIVFKHVVSNKLEDEIEVITFEGKEYKVLCKEATIARIIKKLKNNYNDQYKELIKNFFGLNYDQKKLYKFANKYKVTEAIMAFEAIYG